MVDGLVLLMTLMAALPGADPGQRSSIAVRGDGRVVVRVPGKADVVSHLFLWYDKWQWRRAQDLREDSPGHWSGVFTKKPDDGAGRIKLTQAVGGGGESVDVDYEFSRDGPMRLTSGIFLCFYLPHSDYAGLSIVGTHGPPRTTDGAFEFSARGCTVNLSATEALEISSERVTTFSLQFDDGTNPSLRVRLVPRDMAENGRAALSLSIVPAVQASSGWQAPSQESALSLRGVRADREVAGRFEPVEFTLDLVASYENPFDPEQIAVDATFRTPSGATEHVPGFYYQGFQAEYDDGHELLSTDGGPSWKVRYTPREFGRYQATFQVRDRSGQEASSKTEFRCVGSETKGFARLGTRTGGGPTYFRLDSGESLFLIGHNVTTYSGDLDTVFSRMAAGGENYTRFWMWSRALGLEWGLPVGSYRLEEAWRLDRAIRLAAEHGIYLMICLDTHQDFRDAWTRNPYNAARGGPCSEPMDFFTDARAQALYRRRLRYVVARWGCYPNVLCWEFGNEMEGWPGAQEDRDVVAEWHAVMARVLRDMDPYGHPITSSLWTTEGWPELWELPEMDFIQSHYYANSMWADMAADVAGICRQKLRDYPHKTHVFGEYGVQSGGGTELIDPAGVHLHNGNWAALTSGSASVPVSWWHEHYIDALGLYRVFTGIAGFVRGEPLADREWDTVDVESLEYLTPPAQVLYSDVAFSGLKSSWTEPVPEGTRFVVQQDGTVENLTELPNLLHGMAHQNLRSSFVFEVDCPRASRFSVVVGTVSAGGVLDFVLDGRLVRTVRLPAERGLGKESEWQPEWNIWQTRYDEAFSIDLPAGHHTIELSNRGKDWVRIARYVVGDYVTNEAPPLRVLGLTAEDRALIWVQNRAHTWYNVREGNAVPLVSPTVLRLGGFADGRWRVELWDTTKGTIVAHAETQAREGTLSIRLPAVATDLALKVTR